MDFTTLNRRLADLGVTVPDPRRAALYLHHLEATDRFLRADLREVLGDRYAFVEPL